MIPMSAFNRVLAVCLALLCVQVSAKNTNFNLDIVGRIGGNVTRQALENNTLVVATGAYVKVIDVSNRAKPVEVATIDSAHTINDIQLRNGFLYIASGVWDIYGFGHFQVVDLRVPSRPVKRGWISYQGCDFERLEVSDSRSYVLGSNDTGSYVRTIDISNPDAPVFLSKSLYLYYEFNVEMAIDGTRLYLKENELYTYDVANVTSPTLIASGTAPKGPFKVANNIAYFAQGANGIQVIDFTHPATPHELGTYKNVTDARDLFFQGGKLYVADAERGLLVVNVNDPTSPTLSGRCAVSGPARTVTASGSIATVVDDLNRLTIIDVADPARPQTCGAYDPHLLNASQFSDMDLVDGKIYIAASEDGLRVVDIANPAAPGPVTSYLGQYLNSIFRKVKVNGNTIFIYRELCELNALDATSPTLENRIGACSAVPEDFVLENSTCYTAEWLKGFRIFDFSNPATPVLRGQICRQNELPGSLFVSGPMVYLGMKVPNCEMEGRMQIVDASNPDAPFYRGYINTLGNLVNVFVRDEIAYAAHWFGLKIIDVHDPDRPAIIGSFDEFEDPSKVVVAGHYAFMACQMGIVVIDVENPAEPIKVGFLYAPKMALDIAVRGDLVYVLDYERGLYILRFNPPHNSVGNWASYQ